MFKTIRFPPELWAELEALAPPGKRSAIVQEGLRRELVRLKRAKRTEEQAREDGCSQGARGEKPRPLALAL